MDCARGGSRRGGGVSICAACGSLTGSAAVFLLRVAVLAGANLVLIFSNSLIGILAIGASIPPMPSGVVVHASHSRTEGAPATEVPASSQSASAKLFGEADPSVHMLALPKSYPQLARWMVIAILAGSIAAFGLIAILLR